MTARAEDYFISMQYTNREIQHQVIIIALEEASASAPSVLWKLFYIASTNYAGESI